MQLTQHETDSPILPVVQLEQLHQFRPDLVDWVKNQTEAEAIHRREREVRVDLFILIERMGGLIAGTLIAGFGLAIAAYVGLHDQPVLAGVLGGGTLVGIVTVLVNGRQRSKTSQQASPPAKVKAK